MVPSVPASPSLLTSSAGDLNFFDGLPGVCNFRLQRERLFRY